MVYSYDQQLLKGLYMKICTKCGIEKSYEDFHKRSDTKKYRSHCKECTNKRNLTKYYLCEKTAKSHHKAARKHSLRTKYGISLEDYDEMLKKQNGVCYICKKEEEFSKVRTFKSKSFLCVDHDHKTGKVRSLLCSRCNLVLGYAEDDINKLYKLIEYLKEFNG